MARNLHYLSMEPAKNIRCLQHPSNIGMIKLDHSLVLLSRVSLSNRNLEVYQLEKLQRYLNFILYSLYLSPWAMMFVWHLFVRLGCGSLMTRPHLDSIYLRPYVDHEGGSPWWFDSWDASTDGDGTPDPLSPSNKTLMIGYLDMHDAVVVLRRQVSELEDLPCTNCTVLLRNLLKLLAFFACLTSS